MSVTAFQDLPIADRDREWEGAEAEKRVKSHLAKYYRKMDDAPPWDDGPNR
jgi:hypothetical protein